MLCYYGELGPLDSMETAQPGLGVGCVMPPMCNGQDTWDHIISASSTIQNMIQSGHRKMRSRIIS